MQHRGLSRARLIQQELMISEGKDKSLSEDWNKGQLTTRNRDLEAFMWVWKQSLKGCFLSVEFVHWSQENKYSTACGLHTPTSKPPGLHMILPPIHSSHPDTVLDMTDSGTGGKPFRTLPAPFTAISGRPETLRSVLSSFWLPVEASQKAWAPRTLRQDKEVKGKKEKMVHFSSTHKTGSHNLSQV